MSKAIEAYTNAAKASDQPRELEASLLLKAAGQLQRARDGWASLNLKDLSAILLYNRKLWTIFATSVADEESRLPTQIRQNILNLSVFIFKRTLEIEAKPEPQLLDSLININRQIASGLLQKA